MVFAFMSAIKFSVRKFEGRNIFGKFSETSYMSFNPKLVFTKHKFTFTIKAGLYHVRKLQPFPYLLRIEVSQTNYGNGYRYTGALLWANVL